MFEAVAQLFGQRLTFECERIVAMAAGDTPQLTVLHAKTEAVQRQLDTLGVVHPVDMLAERYRLRGAETLVLTLTLMPHHAPDALAALASVLGDETPTTHPRLWYALALLEVPPDQAGAVASELLESPLFSERLVRTRPQPPEDVEATLHPHLSVLELLGFTQ